MSLINSIPLFLRTSGLILVFMLSYIYGYGQSCDCPDESLGQCGPCVGGLSSLIIEYTGGGSLSTITAQDGEGNSLSTTLLGSEITIYSIGYPNDPFAGGEVHINATFLILLPSSSATIPTSCENHAYQGSIYGDNEDFLVLGGESLSGEPICCENFSPVISACPSDIIVDASTTSCTAQVSWTPPTATDDCGTPTMVSSHNPDDIFPVGTTPVTYTFTDSFGNSSVCGFSVVVEDVTEPVIDCQEDPFIFYLNTSCEAETDFSGYIDSNDNCTSSSNLLITQDPSPQSIVIVPGTQLVTMTVTDEEGNFSSCVLEINYIDFQKPSITCPDEQYLNAGENCNAKIIDYTTLASDVLDYCDGNVEVTQWPEPDVIISGTTTVTLTATDDSGNFRTCTFDVTVVDVTDPEIAGMPANIIVDSDPEDCNTSVTWTAPTASDNCSVTSFTSDYNSGADFPVGTTTVTYTALDGAGNDDIKSFTITVNDVTDPVIAGMPSNIIVNSDAEDCNTNVSWAVPTASDNCAVESLTSDYPSGGEFLVGTTTVTYTALDAAGNDDTKSFTITVNDATDPVIAGMPANIIVDSDPEDCNTSVSWIAPTASDNCAVTSLTSDFLSGANFPVGTTTVTYTALDAAGNDDTKAFTITVNDATNPVIAGMPSNIIVNSDAEDCNTNVSWASPTASDNCAVTSLTSDFLSGADFPVGTTTVTYTALDAAGNDDTKSFTVTVNDVTDPVIAGMPANIVIDSDSEDCNTSVSWIAPTASDNCAVTSLTSDFLSGADFPVGTTTVTYTALDAAGNDDTKSFTITVNDVTDPVIAGMPANIIVDSDSEDCNTSVSWIAPTASDNCAVTSLTSDFLSGADFPVGTTTVTYTALDAAGNDDIKSFTITVKDITPPAITCTEDKTIITSTCTTTLPNYTGNATVSDNCSATVTQSPAPGTILALGTTEITLTATDDAGNSNSCTFDVIFKENVLPVITGMPANITKNLHADSCETKVTWIAPTATDNCGTVTLTSSHSPGDLFPYGITTVTYTATDFSGNVAANSFTVNVKDITAPVITGCPTDLIHFNEVPNCGLQVYWDEPVITDNCTFSYTQTHSPGDFFPKGTTTVTYTATDIAGNKSTCSFKVIAQDNVKPTLTKSCPANININLTDGSCGTVVTWEEPTATDECDTPTMSRTHTPGNNFPVGITTVEYTFTDGSNNKTKCSFLITITEPTSPEITNVPADIIIAAADTICGATVSWPAPTATDNCGVTSFTSTSVSGSVFPLGATTVTYTAKDASGNTATDSFIVTVNDDSSPLITGCPTDTVISQTGSGCSAIYTWAAPTASDNCGVSGLTVDYASGYDFPVGSTLVTYTATDVNGNESTCSFTVTVEDVTDPVITSTHENVTRDLNASCGYEIEDFTAAMTATDNCTVVTFFQVPAAGTNITGHNTEQLITLRATDQAGRFSETTFTITLQDMTGPVITSTHEDLIKDLNESCGYVLEDFTTLMSATDNCTAAANIVFSQTPSVDTLIIGNGTEQVITLRATDTAGRFSEKTFTVTLQDVTDPVITSVHEDFTQDLDGNCGYTISDFTASMTATDNCTVSENIGLSQSPAAGTTITGHSTEQVITLRATDQAGRFSEKAFTITLQDITDPVISSCPESITVSANSSCGTVVEWETPIISDNCDTEPTLTSTHTSGDSFNPGITTVSYKLADEAGNEVTCSFDVTVVDDTAPVFADCPENITLSVGSSCEVSATWTAPTATDNCNSDVTITSDYSSGDAFGVGTTTVTYTATDSTGNASTCTFDVTVTDDTPPVINNCPDNIIAQLESCGSVVFWTEPTVSDNCKVTLTSTHKPGDAFPRGQTEVVYTATDSIGNTTTCSFKIIASAPTQPFITGCPEEVIVATTDGSCEAAVTWEEPIVSEDCSNIELTSTHQPGDVFPHGVTTVVYTAEDVFGNVSTCTFNVVVNDLTGPEFISCPATIEMSTDNSSCGAIVSWETPEITDNCSETQLEVDISSGSLFEIGTTLVTYTATDTSGNVTTCSFNVIITDQEAPVISNCPEDITVSAEPSLCGANVNWDAPAVMDNCGAKISGSISPGSLFEIGTTEVTYTAIDSAGNTATCSFNVIVEDSSAPEITGCPATIEMALSETECSTAVSWEPPVAIDNCDFELTSDHSPGEVFEAGTTTVTYSAKDASGNISTCTFDIIINDETAPQITDCPADIEITTTSACGIQVSWEAPVATDNCGAELTSDFTSGAFFEVGTTAVTYMAVDGFGNSSECTFNVIVIDNTAPELSGCPDDIVVSADESCDGMVNWTLPTVVDNCEAVTLTSNFGSGDVFALGVTEVVYQATDQFGNTSACSFTITVIDDMPPVFTGCPDTDLVIDLENSCDAQLSWGTISARDNCSNVTLTSSHNPGDIFPIGTTEVVYTATDELGNSSTCKFNVILQNDEMPVITGCPADITAEAGESGEVAVDWALPEAEVVCGNVALTGTHEPGDRFPIGITEVEYTATDESGNTATCSFTIDVSFQEIEFEVVRVLTPDGDGVNDEWLLTDIEKFRNNRVIIIDRWGGEIYSAEGYNNQDVVWDGTNKNGQPAPTGTYFYVITVEFVSKKAEKKGFIELVR